MAREHGDLSADVENPEKDWTEKGVTYQAFEAMKPAFAGGLSSRCIVGESGPMHLVRTPRSTCVPLRPASDDFDEQMATCVPILSS